MIIDCISDLHGFYPKLDGGDLLIIAGDLTAKDDLQSWIDWKNWILVQSEKYSKVIIIAGNHDGMLQNKPNGFDLYFCKYPQDKWVYLEDSGTEFEYEEEVEEVHKFKGFIKYKRKKVLKIWGSPWTPTFYDWHFMKDRGAPIKEMWDLIPRDIDILVTHGPPYGILDKVNISSKGDKDKCAGCVDLRNKVLDSTYFTNLKLHVFGHIHEQGGKTFETTLTKFVNASIVNENYEHVNKPVRVIL